MSQQSHETIHTHRDFNNSSAVKHRQEKFILVIHLIRCLNFN